MCIIASEHEFLYWCAFSDYITSRMIRALYFFMLHRVEFIVYFEWWTSIHRAFWIQINDEFIQSSFMMNNVEYRTSQNWLTGSDSLLPDVRYIYTLVHMYLHVHIIIHLCVYIYMYVYIHICMYIYIYVCMYTYMYIHIHIITCIYVYMYMHIRACTFFYYIQLHFISFMY